MNIEFKSIKYKNFLSYGNDYATLDFEEGVDLVLGTNGMGKSTFNDALFYSLFGKAFRKVKTGSLINRTNKKKLEVQVTFNIDEKEYKIIRGMKPNKFEIYNKVEDEYILIEQRAATKDYQKFLEEEVLKINETIFRQLIVLGANLPSSKPFMELTQTEKESLFQVLTDTSIFSHIKEVIKKRLNEKKQNLKEYTYKKDILQSSLDSEKIMINSAEKQNADFIANHNENLRLSQENITNTIDAIEKYKAGLEKLKTLKVKYDGLLQESTALNFDLHSKREINTDEIQKIQEYNMAEYQKLLSECNMQESDAVQIQRIESEILRCKAENQALSTEKMELDAKVKFIEGAEKSSIACTSCDTTNYLTDICDDEVHKKGEYKNKISEIKVLINEKTKETKDLEFELRDFKKSVQEKIQQNKDSIQVKKMAMDAKLYKVQEELQEKLVPLEKELAEVKAEADKLKETLLNGKRLKETLTEKEGNLDFYENKLKELQSIKMVEINYDSLKAKEADMEIIIDNMKLFNSDSDDLNYLENLLGSNNLKGAVIKKQIPFLNKGINHFLELFSMLDYSFVIDENFKERLINRDDDSEFNSLSNGQKARISFSIMFAFLKLIEERNGVKTNILVLDEILDSSVDASGREELLAILKSEFSETKNIIIISHNQEIRDKIEIFDRMIHIEKDKFSSLRVENI